MYTFKVMYVCFRPTESFYTKAIRNKELHCELQLPFFNF